MSEGRQRRDPRAERGRRRPRKSDAPSPQASDATLVIEDPRFSVLVVPDLIDGRLSAWDRDLFGAAQSIATPDQGAVVAVTFEPCRDDLGKVGADRHVALRHDDYLGYQPENRSDALKQVFGQIRPRFAFFADNPVFGGDWGRRLATTLHLDCSANIWKLEQDHLTCLAEGGKEDWRRSFTTVMLLAEESHLPYSGPAREARPLTCEIDRTTSVIEDLGPLPVLASELPLEEAATVLSAGAGLTDWGLFSRLADLLNAAPAGSRVVVDQGHLPRDRQVGASGKRVQARCYLALGISGAPQHLEGIRDCETVLAVNQDPNCPMMARADWSLQSDLDQLLPALEKLLTEGKRNAP